MTAEITQYGKVSVQRQPLPVLPPSELPAEQGEQQQEEEEDIEDSQVLAHLDAGIQSLDLPHLGLLEVNLGEGMLNVQRFTKLESLCLRQNKLKHLPSQVFSRLPRLRDLDLYDNCFGDGLPWADSLGGCLELRSLDLSFNSLTLIPDLLFLPRLEKLYLVQNRISLITPLPRTLLMLELGGNRLRTLGDLGAQCPELTELWLGKNKISSLAGLQGLRALRLLSLQSNRLVSVHGLEGMPLLEEVYFSHNGLKSIQTGLESNLKLHTLDVSNNYLTSLAGISHLVNLQDLWACSNQIPNLRSIAAELGSLKKLETIYLEGNPAQQFEATAYRRKIVLDLPWLKQIDATLIK